MADKFLGAPYPIVSDPRGFLHTQSGINQIKSDLLILLYSNFGERVMMPQYGSGLRGLLFDQNDINLADRARELIIQTIRKWETRVAIHKISTDINIDTQTNNDSDSHVLKVSIEFFDKDDIKNIQELVLEVPLANS